MLFQSKQIKGNGRGHQIGFPTINLVLPEDLTLDEGIYAVWVLIDKKTYKGALHYGAIPTFGQTDKTMEIHLLDVTDDNVPETENRPIEINVVSRLRDVKKFESSEDLALQIGFDIRNVKAILQ